MPVFWKISGFSNKYLKERALKTGSKYPDDVLYFK